MMRAGSSACLVLFGVFAIAACGDNLDVPPEVCDNAVDDDGDGDIDCLDADCAADPVCTSPAESDCDDGTDNDSDGQTDCADADCAADPVCISGPEAVCDDGLDDDNDGQTDCADSDCAAAPNCVPEANCADGLDDDFDGQTDCADSDCATAPNCVAEANCMDGLDDDSDGQIDCADSDCAAAPNCNPEGNCSDSMDNDLDGNVDCADTDCAASCVAGCPAGHTGIQITATGLPLPFGMTPTFVDASMPVTDVGVVSGVAVQVDVTHPYIADADLRLESPSGVITDLTVLNGGSGDNYVDTLFIDSAMNPIGTGTAPFTGSFQPDEPLANHVGGPSNGTWILHAVDNYPDADDGSLDAVDLYLCICTGPECELGPACNDGADNDGDGMIDCADANCAMEPNCLPETVCDDGLDNDLDTLVDCLDMDCDGVGICEFGNETTCGDDLDNDADGDIDCADTQCAAQPLCMAEVDCGDGMDNDGDGLGDCLDPGCDGMAGCELDTELTCGDGVDNDGDGQTDCADADCGAGIACALTCAPGMTKTLYTSTDVPVTIIDVGTVTSTITVPGNGLVSDAAVRIHINHTWDADLDISLTGPGESIDLSSDNGGSADNFINTVFIDSAATSITTGTAPFTGAFRPEQPFTNLLGTPTNGDWDLVVTDDEAGIVGTVNEFELVLCSCDPAAGGPCEFGEACRDGIDNDGNGATDCMEAACATDPFCIPEAACADAADNDLDGDVDCLDDDCDGIDLCEFGTELSCTDGFDNDADGLLDCLDPDCPACPAVCGNNALEFGEGCDDGDVMSGDGCSPACTIEVGFFCSGDPSLCVPGEIEPNEDGTPQTGGSGITGNDFDAAGGVAVMNANNNGAILVSGGGAQLSATLTPAGDEDVFALTNNTGNPQNARFDLWNMTTGFGVGVPCGTSIDPGLNIRSATGTVLASNDDRNGAIDRCSGLTFALAPGQTVYAHVTAFSDNAAIAHYAIQVQFTALLCGDGTLTLPFEECDDGNTGDLDGCSSTCQLEAAVNEVEPNLTLAEADASPVQIMGTTLIRAAINPLGDLDVFRVTTVDAATVLRIETFVGRSGDCIPSTTLDLRLLDMTGTPIIVDAASSGIGNCAALVFTLPAGTFYVQAEERGNNAAVAKYFLEVSFTSAQGTETEPNETSMTADAALSSTGDGWVAGDHSLNADVDVYAITVPAGYRIRAEIIEGAGGETCESNGIDSVLELRDAMGVLLATDDDDGRGFCSRIDGTGTSPSDSAARNATAATQTMFLHVRQSGTGTGPNGQFVYRLQVTLRP